MDGSCQCGNIKYSTQGNANTVVNCHCNLCRKMNGSAFSTYVVVSETAFKLTHGKLQRVQVSENASKFFCPTCGTPIYNENPKLSGLKILYLGALVSNEDIQPRANIYCESRLSWTIHMTSLQTYARGIT